MVLLELGSRPAATSLRLWKRRVIDDPSQTSADTTAATMSRTERPPRPVVLPRARAWGDRCDHRNHNGSDRRPPPRPFHQSRDHAEYQGQDQGNEEESQLGYVHEWHRGSWVKFTQPEVIYDGGRD
jgi:hypothetical protein